jgi:rod shape determining protein RodA
MRTKGDFDWLILICAAILMIVGLGLIYSVFHPHPTGGVESPKNVYFMRQLLWVAAGLAAMLVGFTVPFRYFESLAYVSYAVCTVLLLLVLFVGSGGPAQRWISIGPLAVQPSEFMKIAIVMAWARVLSAQRGGSDRSRKVLLALALAIVPFFLVLRQPDLGTAIIIVLISLPVLFWRGVRGYRILYFISPVVATLLIVSGEKITGNPWPFGIYIVIVFIVAYLKRSDLRGSIGLVAANLGIGVLLPVAWAHLKGYQQNRIISFLDPGSDKLNEGWQVFQSKIAIGSGGLTGKGFLFGSQKALEFLPAKHTDFIFSVLGEEEGFIGALFVIVLFAVLIIRSLYLANKAKSEFTSTVCVGIAAYFFFQTFVNIAMTTGMAPVTGIPLPFLSYGGSSLVVSCFAVGLLLNCSVRWYEY